MGPCFLMSQLMDISLRRHSYAERKDGEGKRKWVYYWTLPDSPFPQLAYLAETLGIDGPILAENGNILWFEGKALCFMHYRDRCV